MTERVGKGQRTRDITEQERSPESILSRGELSAHSITSSNRPIDYQFPRSAPFGKVQPIRLLLL